MVTFKVGVRLRSGVIYPPYVGIVRAVPCLCVLYPGICLTTEEKSMEKISGKLGEKFQLGTIQCVVMAAFEFNRPKNFK